MRTMWVFTLFIPALQVFQGGSMKVILLMWHYNDGYDTSEGVIGIYNTFEGAEVAATAWANTLANNSEDYKYSFEEMEVK